MDEPAERRPAWTFLTNHARVLLIIARDHEVRSRDIAAVIGITERSAQGIVAGLLRAGYVERVREGRHNRYAIVPGHYLRHPSQRASLCRGLAAGREAPPARAERGISGVCRAVGCRPG
ncbi:helix-turn-helix transcriptional regulator [Nonomuraea sp. GTA35]|uniref:helix-turn-helix transcriptional regulator n=1 Tax=Nonomuraea sp. GTA35 TaxID=1676746 RepID=UPI0035C0C469